MEIILQKATELGVSKIIPIVSERTEVKEINFDRAKKRLQSKQLNNQINQALPQLLK